MRNESKVDKMKLLQNRFGWVRNRTTNNSVIRLFGYSVIDKGFTLVELIVVVAMIAILMAALGTAVAKAQTRARISKATQEAKELTNAILAYEQYAPGRSLSSVASGNWKNCDESALSMVLGQLKDDNGQSIPVLYTASLTGGRMIDPWGTAYQLRIDKTGRLSGGGDDKNRSQQFVSAPHLPNYYRLDDGEKK